MILDYLNYTNVSLIREGLVIWYIELHILIALALGLFLKPTATQLILICVGAILPDSDTRYSKIGKVLPLWRLGFKHRGITHSFILPLIIYILLRNIYPNFIYVLFGWYTHIISDMLNKPGVDAFFPLSLLSKHKRFKIMNLKGKGIGEIIIKVLSLLIILYFLISNGRLLF